MAAAKTAAIDNVAGLMGGLGPKVRSNLESGGSLEPALGPMMDKVVHAVPVPARRQRRTHDPGSST